MAVQRVVLLFAVVAILGVNAFPGGWVDGEEGNNYYKKFANVLHEKVSGDSEYRGKVLKITKVQRQVVAGFKYLIEFDHGKSDCLKSDPTKDLEKCNVMVVSHCKAEVWEKPWENFMEVLSHECNADNNAVKTDGVTKDNTDTAKVKAAQDFFNLAKGNIGAVAGLGEGLQMREAFNIAKGNLGGVSIMNQLPDVEEKAPKKKTGQLLGGGDHDVGNYGAFSNFMEKFGKKYQTKEEELNRFSIFRTNMKKAKELQAKEKGSAQYGPTQFADLAEDEFRKYYLTPKWDLSPKSFLQQAEIPTGDAPDAFDWRDHGAVTAVKNQGQCGSCWAFSTTGNVEGQWAIKKKALVSLSEQELVDCDKLDQGCNGGLPSNAYQEIMRLGGLEAESDYPYEGKNDKCEFKKSDVKVDITGGLNISSNEDDMKKWLYQNGPISIGINAMAMQFYMGGVSHPWSIFCNPDSLDHGVLIVGYGVHKREILSDEPYWIIKNSWGASWGEQGYYLVYRGEGVCGLNKMPTSGIVN